MHADRDLGSNNAATAVTDPGLASAIIVGNMNAALAHGYSTLATVVFFGDTNVADILADGAPDGELVVGNGTDSEELQTKIHEVTARTTVEKARMADQAMNAITQYITS